MKPWQHLAILSALGGNFEPSRPGVCSVEPEPAAGGGEKKPDPKPPAGDPPPNGDPPVKPYAVFEDSAALKKRLDRERVAMLKEHGFETEDDLKKMIDANKAAEKAAKDAERAKLSEIERLRADLADRDKAHGALMSEHEELKMRTHLLGVFAQKNIKNTGYALYMVQSKLAGLGDTEELDELAYLDELLADPGHAAALGVAGPPPPKVPANTGPGGAKPPPPPPASGGGVPKVDFRTMSGEEMAAFKSRNNLR